MLGITSIFGQVKFNNVLLREFRVEDRLLKLNLQSEQSEKVILVWQLKNGQQSHHVTELSPGWNELDLSSNTFWKGTIAVLATDNPRVTARLKKMNMRDKLNSFLRPHYLSPRSINFTEPVLFFGYTFRTVLYFVIVIVALIYIFLKTNWRKSIYLGLIAAAILLSLRNTIDEVGILNKFEKDGQELQPFTDLHTFFDQAKPMLEGKKWTKNKLGGVYDSYVKYELAEIEFLPMRSTKKDDLIITNKPKKNKKVLHHYNGIYLIQK